MVHKTADSVSGAPDAERQAYSPSEAANVLGVSRAFIYLRMDDGTLPSVKLGRRRLIPRSAIEALFSGGDAA